MQLFALLLFVVLYSLKGPLKSTFTQSKNEWSPSNEEPNTNIGMAVLIFVIIGMIIAVVALCLKLTPSDAYKLLRLIFDWLLNQDSLFDYNALSLAVQIVYHFLC